MIRPTQIRRVFVRHVTEIARDRRTLITLLMVPIITVLVLTLSREELAGQISPNSANIEHQIAVNDVEAGGEFLSDLTSFASVELIETDDVRAAVRDGRATIGMILPRNFERKIERGERVPVAIIQGQTTIRASLAEAALEGALNGYARRVVNERLAERGIDPELVRPLKLEPESIATDEQRSGSILSQFLPLLVIAQILSLMIALTVDMTAGEKERRTLEALLTTPLHRREIVFGKWLVAVAVGTFGGAMTVLVAILTLRLGSSNLLTGDVRLLPSGAITSLLLGGFAAALVLASIQLTIGFVARSTQQAGAMSSPLFFVAFVPLFFFADATGTTTGLGLYSVPTLGPMLLARFGLAGTAVPGAMPVAVLTSIVYAVAILMLADRVFRSEKALRRT